MKEEKETESRKVAEKEEQEDDPLLYLLHSLFIRCLVQKRLLNEEMQM